MLIMEKQRSITPAQESSNSPGIESRSIELDEILSHIQNQPGTEPRQKELLTGSF